MKVQVCSGWSCKSKFSEYIIKRLENDTIKFWYKKLQVESTSCLWWCKKWPNIKINGGDTFNYQDPAKVAARIQTELLKK
jgi:NADH:ubiquinone oxidoreductase subunit E